MRIGLLYTRAILREFRGTLIFLAILVLIGGLLYHRTPAHEFDDRPADWPRSFYAAWMALFAQPVFIPQTWPLTIVCTAYPIFGFTLIGEGVVRLGLLMMSRRAGENQWMRVMASTYRDHVIVCGLGHLGVRAAELLANAGVDVVALESDGRNRFITQVKEKNVPVLIRDMKEDQALLDAGVQHARAIVIATNDDMANLEVALDSRRLNAKIRVVMRLFDQRIAEKISGALTIDAAFSTSALAAPSVAALALDTKVLASVFIAGVPYVTAELWIDADSQIAGKRVDQLELGFGVKLLAKTTSEGVTHQTPAAATTIAAGDKLLVHAKADQLPTLARAAKSM